MAYSTISKPSLHFNTNLYTGNGSTQHSITGVGFQPDWTWIKSRDDTYNHFVFDAVRGVGKQIFPNLTNAESTNMNNLYSFNTDGFSLAQSGNDDVTNKNNSNFASWNWKANGAGSANTDGGINSTVSVNNTAGFSIVKYGTGTGSATTVGHGLNAKPNFIIVKPLGTITTGGWIVGGDNIDSTYNNVLNLDESSAKANDPSFNDTAPTSSVFSVGNNNTNRSGENYIAYCFVEKKGYSKFGSYTGNGNADGAFIYTGFKPAWVLVKCTSTSADWELSDNKRTTSGGNVIDKEVRPNTSAAETGGTDGRYIDYYSNGFKLTQGFGNWNADGETYIYIAFAEEPLVANVGSSIPATAR
jgi:hypothetical protein